MGVATSLPSKECIMARLSSRESAKRQRREGARRASELQASREPQQRALFRDVVALGWREGKLQRKRRKAKKRGREARAP
jgi:hypothetical protein